ncbi:hypothetical protein, partial [Pluralibacter gergoviae]|uniref:hypothetical protein n=1 Tax=Pluralibacter gergoviae TaxID=61647 RepID=UPI000ACB6C74
TFNQLVAGSNPARPTNVKRRPKGAFLLCAILDDSNLLQVRVERSETTEPLAATALRTSEASHPARPTNVKRRPKGAFLLCAILDDSNLLQVRVERSETTEPLAATALRTSEASHPARPTNVKRRPKGAFLLCAVFKDSNLQQVSDEYYPARPTFFGLIPGKCFFPLC